MSENKTLTRAEIAAAIAYFEEAVGESDEIISACSPALRAELEEQRRHFAVALEALNRETPPNEPLTLEELREMNGEPVWVTPGGFWALVHITNVSILLIENSGETASAEGWIKRMGPIYRRKPDGGGECWEPVTNGDDVRSMSDKELAEFLEQVGDGGKCLVCENLSRCRRNNATEPVCSRHIKDWLQQSTREEGEQNV